MRAHRFGSKRLREGAPGVPRRLLAMSVCILAAAWLPAPVSAGNEESGTDTGLIGSSGNDYVPPAPGTYQLPIIKMAADGEVLDATGQKRSLRDLTRGAVTVLSFIYTRCAAPRACPYATGVLNQVHQMAGADPELKHKVRLVSLSFDPEFDTPARLAEYSRWARERDLPVTWHFLTTRSRTELKPILAAYGQAVDERRDKGHPMGPLNHVLRVFIIDASGAVRNIYSSDTLDPRLVMGDIRTLLCEAKPTESKGHP